MHKRMTKYFFENDFSQFSDYIKTFSIKEKHYSAGDIISSQAATLNSGYYIVSGIMKLSIGITVGEAETTLALFGPGSIFPLGINEHHYSLEYAISETAFTDVIAYEFNFTELRKIFEKNNQLALRMMEHYCDFTSFLFYQIAILSSNDIFTNVITILEALSHTSLCKNNKLSLSQMDFASLTGASKIQIARAYKYLKSNNIIAVERNCIIIKDSVKLSTLNENNNY